MIGVIPLLFLVGFAGSMYWGTTRDRLPHVFVGWAWLVAFVVCIVGLIFVTGGKPVGLPAWSGVCLLAIGVVSITGSAAASAMLYRRSKEAELGKRR